MRNRQKSKDKLKGGNLAKKAYPILFFYESSGPCCCSENKKTNLKFITFNFDVISNSEKWRELYKEFPYVFYSDSPTAYISLYLLYHFTYLLLYYIKTWWHAPLDFNTSINISYEKENYLFILTEKW